MNSMFHIKFFNVFLMAEGVVDLNNVCISITLIYQIQQFKLAIWITNIKHIVQLYQVYMCKLLRLTIFCSIYSVMLCFRNFLVKGYIDVSQEVVVVLMVTLSAIFRGEEKRRTSGSHLNTKETIK